MGVAEKSSVVDRARGVVASRTVFIRSNTTGVVPMERRIRNADGSSFKNVSRCEYNQFGKMLNRVDVRPLNFGTNGIQIIDPSNPDDVELLDECKLWLEEGSDARIALFGITIQEGGSVEGPPIPRYDKYKVDALIQRLEDEVNLIADDDVEVRNFLEACARYELQRVDGRGKASRQKVLDAVADLGVTAGIEYGTDEVDEE